MTLRGWLKVLGDVPSVLKAGKLWQNQNSLGKRAKIPPAEDTAPIVRWQSIIKHQGYTPLPGLRRGRQSLLLMHPPLEVLGPFGCCGCFQRCRLHRISPLSSPSSHLPQSLRSPWSPCQRSPKTGVPIASAVSKEPRTPLSHSLLLP